MRKAQGAWAFVLLFVPAAAGAGLACRIHDADEVARTRIHSQGDELVFVDAAGREWPLLTSTAGAGLSSAGSSGFVPIEAGAVRLALQSIGMESAGLSDADIYLLPLPRRDLLESSTDGRALYLSPGLTAMPDEQVAALVAHEIGHLFHETFLPDRAVDGWRRYRGLRGLEDEQRFQDRACHADRPHEIFAEDFRVLFGGPAARGSGAVENSDIPLPETVPGLREFFVGLATGSGSAPVAEAGWSGLRAFPNPTRGAVRLLLAPSAGTGPATLTIVDATGRLVERRTVESPAVASAFITWDGRLLNGEPAPAGVYFATISIGAMRATTRIVAVR